MVKETWENGPCSLRVLSIGTLHFSLSSFAAIVSSMHTKTVLGRSLISESDSFCSKENLY